MWLWAESEWPPVQQDPHLHEGGDAGATPARRRDSIGAVSVGFTPPGVRPRAEPARGRVRLAAAPGRAIAVGACPVERSIVVRQRRCAHIG